MTNNENERSTYSLMQIFVKALKGNLKTIVLEVKSSDTFDDVRAKIQDKTGLPAYKQRLIFGGMPVDTHERTLPNHNIRDGETLPVRTPGALRLRAASLSPAVPTPFPDFGMPLGQTCHANATGEPRAPVASARAALWGRMDAASNMLLY